MTPSRIGGGAPDSAHAHSDVSRSLARFSLFKLLRHAGPPPAGVNLSQDVPPFCWDVPPEIENVGRPSHPPSNIRDGGWGLYWASLSSSYGSCFKYLYE